MALITPERLQQERQQHREVYGVSGWRWKENIQAFADDIGATSILDYGAGKGTLSEVLENVTNYDPVTFPGNPVPADLVVVTDVLEFVEDRRAVLMHIETLARKGVFVVVPQHPQAKARPGKTIKPPEWWERLLAKHWPAYEADVVEFCGGGIRQWTAKGTPRLRFKARC